jgi:hypothetical protein
MSVFTPVEITWRVKLHQGGLQATLKTAHGQISVAVWSESFFSKSESNELTFYSWTPTCAVYSIQEAEQILHYRIDRHTALRTVEFTRVHTTPYSPRKEGSCWRVSCRFTLTYTISCHKVYNDNAAAEIRCCKAVGNSIVNRCSNIELLHAGMLAYGTLMYL